MKDTYTTEEAAAELGVSSARVRQLILDGTLKTERFGRAHVITRGALDAARQRQTTPGPPPPAPKPKPEKAPRRSRKKTGAKPAP
jgi:excisionase family DNA binding protein